ncbi:MAG: VOC family protein [Nocardioidaceae bacterium]|nr:VOC family protein [Nocardioidaceae bacterium]
MALARFKKICIDAVETLPLAEFWGAALGQRVETDDKGEAGLVNAEDKYTIWFNKAPQPKTVKHRVHLDIYAKTLADLESLGGKVLVPQRDDRRWTVMADPEGGEFCAFLRDDMPVNRLHGLVVDCTNPTAQAKWWGKVLKAEVVHHDEYSTVQQIKKLKGVTLDFVPVPERKSEPNRIHWDVSAKSMDGLVDLGAKVLRLPDDDIRWTVLADPEGNEFCAFPRG